MSEKLFETSSIFARNSGPAQSEIVNLDKLSEEQIQSIEEIQSETQYCRTINFSKHSEKGNLNLVTLFPDSMFAILRDRNHNHFYVANLDGESFIVEVPFTDYQIIAVAQKVIVLGIHTLDGLRTIKVEGKDYTFLEGVEVDRKDNDLVINGKKYNRESTEEKPPEKLPDGARYFFKDANLVVRGTTDLYEQDKRDGKHVLIANENGCYLGYYLLVREGDGLVNFNGVAYEVLSRLTISLTVVQSVRDFKVYLIPCGDQQLIPIEELTTEKWEDIEIANGIALLFGPPSSQSRLHVFTPSWQKVVLTRGMKLNFKAIGNGIVVPKDNVLLLDTGMLRFIEKVDKQTIFIPTDNVEVPVPIPYLGDL